MNTDLYVVIENCTILNCGTTYPQAGIRLYNVKNVNITKADLDHNYIGVFLQSSSNNNIIEHTRFQGGWPPTNYGIRADSSSSNTIRNCTFVSGGCIYAICFYGAVSNTIRNCTIIGDYISLASNSHQNTIYKNRFISTTSYSPLIIGSSNFVNVTENTFTDCNSYSDTGVVDLNGANNCTIARNNITSGVTDPYAGIHVESCSGAVVKENRVNGNIRGIFLEYGQYNRIFWNDFSGNTYDGQASGTGVNWFDDGVNGNYWGDYSTLYPSAINNGIIWETPYTLAATSVDRYPLVARFVYQQNVNLPRLTSGMVNPLSANMNTQFTFSVVYTDDDNNRPNIINVIVNGTSFPLQKSVPADTNYLDGCQYQTSLYLQPGVYTYRFFTSDPSFTNTTGILSGPTVSIVNDYAPVLSQFLSYPMIGYAGMTTCWFKATYSDADNNAPVSVQITIDGSSTFPMIRENPADLNYTDGTVFYYTTLLGLGPHNFSVMAWDASRNTTSGVLGGPTIKQNMDWDLIDLNGKRIGCVITHGESNPITHYSTFVNSYLAPRGVNITTISSALSAAVLANYDMLWVDDNGGAIPGAQLDALFTWLAGGGRLFTSGALTPTSVSSILARLNMTIYSSGTAGGTTSDFTPHPIVDGVGTLKFQNIDGSRVNLTRQPLAVSVVRYAGECFVSAMAYGYGAIVDLRSYYFISNNYNQNDNLEFLQNVFGWLGYVNKYSPQLTAGKVMPSTGSQNTLLEFSVTYTDADDNSPLSVTTIIDGFSYSMTKVNASDTNYKNGATFQMYRYLQPGIHTYRFECADTELSNSTSNYTISITYTSSASPTLENPSVTPVYSSSILTTFTYSVLYRDNDNNMPAWINVTIDGVNHTMTMVDPLDYNAMDGVLYRYTTLLGWGVHRYKVACSDGTYTTETTTSTSPEVNPFSGSTMVVPISPANGASLFTGSRTFTWDSLELGIGPMNYTLELSNTTTFATILQSQGGILETTGNTSASIYVLLPTGTYYWRVRPVVNGAYGNATNIRSIFMTYNENQPQLATNVVPTTGDQLTLFNFTTTYTDADNNAPYFVNVSINGTMYAMSKFNPGDTNYADGCLYCYKTLLSIGTCSFFFTSGDGKYTTTTTVNTSVTVIRVNNYAPSLVNPQLSPSIGTNVTTFAFSIWYYDQDNNLPVCINITINGTGPGTGTFNMTKSVPSDMNATDGILYVHASAVDWGMHRYIIRCYDDPRSNDTGWLTGPEVNPFTGLTPTTTVIFSDDFERALLGTDWTVTGTAGISTATHNSGTRSAYHCADAGSVTTRVIDTSGFSSIIVSFWVRKGGAFSDSPDTAAEDLFVEYYASGGTWTLIVTYSGLDPAGTIYTITNQELPWDACHAGFRIRFRQEGGGGLGTDYWHFDDVIVASSPLYTLVSPLNDRTVFTGTTTFSWESLGLPLGLVNWTWQLSNDTGFSSVILQLSGVQETIWTTSVNQNLLFSTGQYAWRVRPEYKGIAHAWSDTIVFNLVHNENPPQLAGLVIPDPSNLTYVHNFTVTYMDPDNNPPFFVNVTINGTQHAMAKVNSSDSNYADGCLYYLEIALPEGYNYFSFNTGDGKYNVSTPLNTSLYVARINNNDPQLRTPQVNPPVGNDTTIFSFSVWYYDADNNLPAWVNLTINGTGTFTLDPVNSSDTNAVDGILYQYNTMLGLGMYQFMFTCNDINRVNSTAWILGPDVNLFHSPTITGVSFSPMTGTASTVFNFTATYTDQDNDLPAYVRITINATGTFNMTKVNPGDNTATDGIIYQYLTTVPWGSHEFTIECSDGARTATRSFPGPDINPFQGYSGTYLPISPTNGTTVNMGNTTFTWQSLDMTTTAIFFRWQLSSTSWFASILQEVTGIVETSGTSFCEINLQQPSGVYYWRVRAYYMTFTIAPSAPFTLNLQDNVPSALFTSNVSLSGAGDMVQFNFTGSEGDGPASFSWDFGDGTANSTARDPVHAFATPGNYTVTLIVTDVDGDPSMNVAGITVVSYPELVQPSSLYVTCMQGSSGTFGLLLQDDTSGSGNFTMTISGNATAFTNVSWVNGVVANVNANTADAGTFLYTIAITNANHFTTYVTITVFIDDYPAITSGSQDFSIDKERGSVFLNWTIVDSLGAGAGTYIVYRNGARVGNGTWISAEIVAVLIDVDIPVGSYNYTIRIYFNGNPTWYTTDTVWVTIKKSQAQQPSFFEEYWYVFVAASVGAAILITIGIVAASRKRAKAKKVEARGKEDKKQLPDVSQPGIGKQIPDVSMPPPMVGKVPPKLAEGKAAMGHTSDTGQERKFSAKELQDIKATAEQVTAFKEAKTCIVHKGPITGTIYVCPQCDSLYCLKCAKALKESGQQCWTCGIELLKEEEEEKKDLPPAGSQ
nr:NosD domain-containing protein [Candidatus Sigynarchaeum springense]